MSVQRHRWHQPLRVRFQATKAERSRRVYTAAEHAQIAEDEYGGSTRVQLRASARGAVKEADHEEFAHMFG